MSVVGAVICTSTPMNWCGRAESRDDGALVPSTVDGLIWAASMVVLDASRRLQQVPRLAVWSLGAGIVATAGAIWHLEWRRRGADQTFPQQAMAARF